MAIITDNDPLSILGNATGTSDYNPEPPPADEKEARLVGQLQSCFLRADQFRSQYANEWMYYEAALFAGDRGVELRQNGLNGDLINITNLNKKDLNVKNNFLIVAYNAWLGKMTRAQPRRTVSPGNGSLSEILGCRAADRLIEIATGATKLNLKLDAAKSDIPWGSSGYLEVMWDPEGGGQIGSCQTCGYEDSKLTNNEVCPHCAMLSESWQQQASMMGQPQAPGMAPTQSMPPAAQSSPAPLPGVSAPMSPPPPQPMPMTLTFKGAPRVDHVDPRCIYMQPGVDRQENVQYYWKRVPLPVVEIRRRFPESAAKVRAEPVYPANGSIYNIDARTGTFYSNQVNDECFLYEYNEKASLTYPKGRRIYMANSRVLRVVENPYYKFKRFPLFRFGWLRVPGSLYGLAPLANAYQMQEQLNEVETIKREHMILAINPKFINPQNSGVSADEVTARTVQILRPKRAFKDDLKYLTGPQMPPELYNQSSNLKEDIRGVMSVTGQELGSVNSDPNGRYAAIAQAASDQSIGHILRQHYDEEADIIRCLLVLYQMFMPPEESFSKFNEDFLEEYSFADLDFDPMNLEVIIDSEDGFASNQATRIDQLGNWISMGVFGTPGTPDFQWGLLQKAARLKIPGIMPDRSDYSVQNANAVIKMVERGEEWQPLPEDNAEIFANIMTEWLLVNGRRNRMTMKNPQMPEKIRQIKEYYDNIVFQTEMAKAQQGMPIGPGSAKSASQPGSGLSPGGTPSATAGGSDPSQSGVLAQSQSLVNQADRSGDAAARGGAAHES